MDETKSEKTAGYPSSAAPGPGSLEYQAMDNLAKMFEKQVEDMRRARGTEPNPARPPQ